MATIITMPAVVADATEAAIQEWLVAVGDTIAAGQPIAEIETEKATVELEAETHGTVGRLLINAGTSVEVGDPIAVLVEPGEDDAAVDQQIAAAGGAAASSAANPVPSDTEAPTTPLPGGTQSATETAAASADPISSGRVFSSPLARKMAKDAGVDVTSLNGSGPHGRILRRDVEVAMAQAPEATGTAAAVNNAAAPETGKTAPASAATGPGSFEEVPVSGMRRAIARRLTESKTTVPHFYLSIDVTMDALLELRAQVNAGLGGTGFKATVNDLVLKALAGALADVPVANAIWYGDTIRRYSGVDVSVAIATKDGLLTPVLRDLDKLSISALSQAMADYKERAATGRIRQHELEGGVFSLTNLGMYGTKEFTAILNPPQSGILAVGAAEQRPVVRDGSLSVATVMTCTLSADHRVIDGAVAAELMSAFKQRIENPLRLLL